MLVSFAAEHLDDLSSARRLAVYAMRLNPVTYAGAGFNGLIRHQFTSFDAIKPLSHELVIGGRAKPAVAIYGCAAGAEAVVPDQGCDQPRASDDQQEAGQVPRRQADPVARWPASRSPQRGVFTSTAVDYWSATHPRFGPFKRLRPRRRRSVDLIPLDRARKVDKVNRTNEDLRASLNARAMRRPRWRRRGRARVGAMSPVVNSICV
jgi:hypothetical protein